MKALIKFLFKYLFLLFIVTGLVFLIGYMYRSKTRSLEGFIRENVMTHILPDTTGRGIAVDTVLTAEEELALEIQRRQDEWERRFTALDSMDRVISARQDSIEAVRRELLTQQEQLTVQEGENLQKLAKLYEQMNSDQASLILLQLDDQTVAEILFRMKDGPAAEIIQQLDPTRAADIINRLRRMQSSSQEQL